METELKVDLYAVCWNERDMLPFFFEHYDPVVDRYFIYDDGSDDGTLDLLRDHPKVVTCAFPRTVRGSFVGSQQDFQNEVWKSSRGEADWVIVTAIDEHITFKPGLTKDHLHIYMSAGATLIPALGYEMIAGILPATECSLSRSIGTGVFAPKYNKLSLFRPDRIKETGFSPGRHRAFPTGDLKIAPWDELMLLHYRHVGFERTFKRNLDLAARLGQVDRANRWGGHYDRSREVFREHWHQLEAAAHDVRADDFRAWSHAPVKWRWWRAEDFVDPGPPWDVSEQKPNGPAAPRPGPQPTPVLASLDRDPLVAGDS